MKKPLKEGFFVGVIAFKETTLQPGKKPPTKAAANIYSALIYLAIAYQAAVILTNHNQT